MTMSSSKAKFSVDRPMRTAFILSFSITTEFELMPFR